MLAMIVDTADALSDSSPPDLAALVLSPQDLSAPEPQPQVSVPQAIADDDLDSPRPVTEANGDAAGHALMFGRYMGQITARIERAWLRPRTAIGAASFSCRVRIRQDHSGNVEEVELRQCNGNARWQMSLVQAIQSASPLPAPPDPGVFTRMLTVELNSQPYESGGPGDGFEPETLSAMQVTGGR